MKTLIFFLILLGVSGCYDFVLNEYKELNSRKEKINKENLKQELEDDAVIEVQKAPKKQSTQSKQFAQITEICDDGLDNDRDGLIDCEDVFCKANYRHCFTEICNDGIDNARDGLTDCRDADCQLFKICNPEICNDGIDNDGVGGADCDDPDCSLEPHCAPKAPE